MEARGHIRAATARCLVLALGLAACTQAAPTRPQLFDIPSNEAFDRLQRADIIGFRNAAQCGMLIYFTPHPEGRQAIRWTVSTEGYRVAEFTVRLAAVGARTEARIELPFAPDGREIYDGSREYEHPALNQPVRPVIEELIEAAMMRRPFDVHRIPDPVRPDSLCISLAINFEASGEPYRITDPGYQSHAQAMEERAKGIVLVVKQDPGVEKITENSWSN